LAQKTELKNMNPFRNVQVALEYEVKRQEEAVVLIASFSLFYNELFSSHHVRATIFPQKLCMDVVREQWKRWRSRPY